jgi:hypothetical protein
MDDFNVRWNIELSPEESRRKLVNRLKIVLPNVRVYRDEDESVAFVLGVSVGKVAVTNQYDGSTYVRSTDLIESASSISDLAKIIEVLLSVIPDFSNRGETVAQLINDSGLGLSMKLVKEQWLTFPAGEKMLDEELVNKPLKFLKGEPLNEYVKALEHYSQGKWEESAEKTRRTLEEYLRHRTRTTKGLGQLIPLVATTLKARKEIPDHLRNTINSILRALDENYNESSKHNSKTHGKVEAEFLIYQVGLLMRLFEQIDM